MNFQTLELSAILTLNEESKTLVKNEIERFNTILDDSLEGGKFSKGIINILKDAGYSYNMNKENPFFVEHLFNIALSKLQKVTNKQ